MFNNLLESKAKKQRRVGGTVFSFVAHYGLVILAIYATAQAAQEDEKPKDEKVEFVQVKKEEPPKPKEPPPPELTAAPPPPKGFQVLTAPVDIPDVLPDIDLTRRVTNEADFTGKGIEGGIAKGVEKKVEVNEDQYVLRVPGREAGDAGAGIGPAAIPGHPAPGRGRGRSARARSSSTPRDAPRRGRSRCFGRTHDLFAKAVQSALPRMRFIPGRGRRQESEAARAAAVHVHDQQVARSRHTPSLTAGVRAL